MGASGRRAVLLVVTAGLFVLCALSVRAEAPGTYGDVYRWYFEAAEAGDPEAQLLLGIRYEAGVDFEQSDRKAADWYERAARQGLAEAQFKLAVMFAEGRGRPKNISDAVAWYRKAADQGYAPAQYNLGVWLLETAKSLDENVRAAAWIMRAESGGLPQADTLAARIRESWPAEVVERVEAEADRALR